MTYISWSSEFALYLKDCLMYEHLTSELGVSMTGRWPKNKCRSLWPIFHGPVILPYILKSIWCMNIILWGYESVWHDIWPQNKCRSLWPIFHGPVILPYILKSIWYMNTILWDYESVWPDVWRQNICSILWPIFHGPVILSNILKTIGIMSQYDPTYDLQIFVQCPSWAYITWRDAPLPFSRAPFCPFCLPWRPALLSAGVPFVGKYYWLEFIVFTRTFDYRSGELMRACQLGVSI